jgi:hypothetical protein
VVHQFGGSVTALDRATGVTLAVRVFGELACECDAPTAARIRAVVLETVTRLVDESPSGAKIITDPVAFPTTIEPAIGQAIAQRGLPAVRIGSFNMSLTSETIDALKSAAQRPKPATAPPPVTAISVGASVLVQWSDGNRYAGQVRAVGDGALQVAFPDGQVHWVATAYITQG